MIFRAVLERAAASAMCASSPIPASNWARGRAWIPLGEDCVRSLRAETVVQPLEMGAHPGLGRRRQLEVGEGGTKVQTGTADDDRRAPGRQDLVDRCVSQVLVLADGGLVLELPDRDETRWIGRLVRQQRDAAVYLSRVRGDELGRDPCGERFRHSALAGRRRPEEADDELGQAATSASWAPLSVVEVAPAMRTRTRSPAAALPPKFTVV